MLKDRHFNKLKSISLGKQNNTDSWRLNFITNPKQFPWFSDIVSAYVDVGKHAMECYFNHGQGEGVQLLVLEGYGLLKPDSTWMDSIHFHHSTLRKTFRRLSYYQHFTLKEVASGHCSPGCEPETVTTPPCALKTLTPWSVCTG